MSSRTDVYAGSDWYTEAERGRNIHPGHTERIKNFYPPLHPWEREQGTDLERARLNESRARRDSMDYMGDLMERLTNRMRTEEQRSKDLYKIFDRMLDALERNVLLPEPVPLEKILTEIGTYSSINKSLRILQAIEADGVRGATDREGSQTTGVGIKSYRRLRGRLKTNGSVIDSGFKRASNGSREQTVWVSKNSAPNSYNFSCKVMQTMPRRATGG